MELLLILSAMLSALTGAFAGVREPEARIHQQETAIGSSRTVAVAAQQAALVVPAIPANVAPAPLRDVMPDLGVAAATPLYADRLIE